MPDKLLLRDAVLSIHNLRQCRRIITWFIIVGCKSEPAAAMNTKDAAASFSRVRAGLAK